MPSHSSSRDHSAREFEGDIVAITGGSAGVGRATARAFARKGATIALIARDRDALEATKAEIESIGGRAMCYPADVADDERIFEVADEIERDLGPIGIWGNNAMATVFSPVSELTPKEIRRVTEVTYLGYVHGTMAALRYMKKRNHGVIVQVGSSLAYRGIPLQAPYCAAKHAMRGFTDSLRVELMHEDSRVALTTVHLPAINTPQFDWARAHQEFAPRPVAPVYGTAVAARAILHAARDPRREYWLGTNTPLTIIGNKLAPGLMDHILSAQAVTGQSTGRRIDERRRDNLFRPVSGRHRTEGSFGGEARGSTLLFPAPTLRLGAAFGSLLAAGLIGAAVVGGLASMRR
jgi:NAD(P)-dependent dehydrogenase (short-subunit alcohol dehydrogenase family)